MPPTPWMIKEIRYASSVQGFTLDTELLRQLQIFLEEQLAAFTMEALLVDAITKEAANAERSASANNLPILDLHFLPDTQINNTTSSIVAVGGGIERIRK